MCGLINLMKTMHIYVFVRTHIFHFDFKFNHLFILLPVAHNNKSHLCLFFIWFNF